MENISFHICKPRIFSQNNLKRKNDRPNVKNGDHVLIYSTVPDKSILGFAKIKRIIELTPDEMWNKYNVRLGIDKERFDQYYFGFSKSIGRQVSLDTIRSFFPKFAPPQTYKYISKIKALRTFKNIFKPTESV